MKKSNKNYYENNILELTKQNLKDKISFYKLNNLEKFEKIVEQKNLMLK